MRLTEKFGASDETGPIIKRSLDSHLTSNPIIDNTVSVNHFYDLILILYIL
jgi:hypothetical protein